MCSFLVHLGNFIGLFKSIPVPQTRIRFVGFLCDSILQAFLIRALLFNHTLHKGLRGNSTPSFSVRSSSNSDICVVHNVMLYPNICCLVSYPNIWRLVDMSQGYLFHATSKADQISDEPFTDSQLLIVLNRILRMLAETVTKLPKAFTLDVLLLKNCWEFLRLILPSTYVGAPLAW